MEDRQGVPNPLAAPLVFILFFLMFDCIYYMRESNLVQELIIFFSAVLLIALVWLFIKKWSFEFSGLTYLTPIFALLILFGSVMTINVTFFELEEINEDGQRNIVMGETFFERGEFYEKGPSGNLTLAHRYSPIMPLYLGAFSEVFGRSVEVYKAATVVTFFLLIGVAFFLTRDLYGARAGSMVAGITAFVPRLWDSCANAQTECLSFAIYAVIIWAILKSLERRPYIIVAGFFAGLGYLTRSSIGFFFVFAGIVGFFWRFHYMKWRVVKDRYYIIAIFVFATIVGIWSLRNIYRFWDGSFQDLFLAWQTDQHLSRCIGIAVERPGRLLLVASTKIFWLMIMLSPWIFLTGSQLMRLRKHFHDERVSGIAISFLIPLVISSIICAIFSIGEGFDHNPVLNWDNNRYILVCVIPLLWYAFEVERKEGGACKNKDANGRGDDVRRSAIPRPRRPRASIPQASDRRRRASLSSARPITSSRGGPRPPSY